MWKLILAFGSRGQLDFGVIHQGLADRPTLLRQCERIIRLFPSSEHIPRAKETATLLRQMIAEEAAHVPMMDNQLASLPLKARVTELIFRLRDQNGHQWSQPGTCDIFDDSYSGEKNSTAAHQLVDLGYEAVPQLIEALEDTRFVRSVGCHRNFYFSHYVLTVGQCAQAILERIATQEFALDRVGYSTAFDKQRMAGIREQATLWWEKSREIGETKMLESQINSGRYAPELLVEKLRVKAPEKLVPALIAGYPNAKEYRKQGWLRLLGQTKDARVIPLLLQTLLHEENIPMRAMAALELHRLGHEEAIPALIRLWDQNVSPSQLAEYHVFSSLSSALAESADLRAIQALERPMSLLDPAHRAQIVGYLSALIHTEKKTVDDKVLQAVEKCLVDRLQDEGIRKGMSISLGDFSVNAPEVRFLALQALHDLNPKKYSFTFEGKPEKLEQEYRAAADAGR